MRATRSSPVSPGQFHIGGVVNRLRFVLAVFTLLLAMMPAVNSQSVTGQISGTVTDPAGAVVFGAKVQLTNDLSKQVREFTSESKGAFIFSGLVPGRYSIRVAQPGFKTYHP